MVQPGARRPGSDGIPGNRCQRGFCKLHKLLEVIGFESHPLRHLANRSIKIT